MAHKLSFPGRILSAEELPALLTELNLMPLLLRRYLERVNGNQFNPSHEEQIAFQKTFLARERITDQASLLAWLQRQGITEPQMSQQLFRAL